MSKGGGIAAGIGGLIGGAYAGNKAASAGRGAANAGYNQLSTSQQQALDQLNPYSQYGKQALIPLSALLYGKNYDPNKGEFTGDVAQQDRFNAFQQSPGYQYQLDQGLKAIQRQNAATGTLLGGNTLKELQQYGSNLANQDYNNYINTLMAQAGIGQQAATNSAGIIQNLGSQMAGYQYAGGMMNAQKYTNLSNALFGIAGQGFSSALSDSGQGSGGGNLGGGLTGGSSTASLYNPSMFSLRPTLSSAMAASDIALKDNIKKIGEENGFNIYEFNYKWNSLKKFRGVIAQEIQKLMPEAVSIVNGFLAVNYDKIGIKFEEISNA